MRFSAILLAGLVAASCSATDARSDEALTNEGVADGRAAPNVTDQEQCPGRSISNESNAQPQLAWTFTGDPLDEAIGVLLVEAIEAVRVGATTDLTATPVGLGELTDSGFASRVITETCDSDLRVAMLANPRSDSLAFVEVVSELPECEVARARVLLIEGRWVLDGFEIGGSEQEEALCEN